MTAVVKPTVAELQQAAMIELFGLQFNMYALTIIIMLFVFLFLLFKAQRARRLDWMDMITRDGTKVSTTKILQLVGGVVGTWIVIKMTIQGVLSWDMYAIYLGYVASVDGFSKLIMAKYGAQGSDDSHVPFRRNMSLPPQQYHQQYNQPEAGYATASVDRGSAKAIDPRDQ